MRSRLLAIFVMLCIAQSAHSIQLPAPKSPHFGCSDWKADWSSYPQMAYCVNKMQKNPGEQVKNQKFMESLGAWRDFLINNKDHVNTIGKRTINKLVQTIDSIKRQLVQDDIDLMKTDKPTIIRTGCTVTKRPNWKAYPRMRGCVEELTDPRNGKDVAKSQKFIGSLDSWISFISHNEPRMKPVQKKEAKEMIQKIKDLQSLANGGGQSGDSSSSGGGNTNTSNSNNESGGGNGNSGNGGGNSDAGGTSDSDNSDSSATGPGPAISGGSGSRSKRQTLPLVDDDGNIIGKATVELNNNGNNQPSTQ